MNKMKSLGVLLVLGTGGAASAVPPLEQNLGSLYTTGAYRSTDSALVVNQIKWYRFTTPGCNAADNSYLDIDTNANPTIAGTAIVDTEIGLYDASGALIQADDDSGSGTPRRRSELSFGAGGRPGVNNSLDFSGFSGASLAAGEYYVAVGAFNTDFGAAAFSVTSGSTTVGTYRLELRSGRMASATPPVIDADLGNLRGVGTLGVSPDMATSGSTVRWVKFHLDFATSATGYFCDIHTLGSNLPGTLSNHDTVLALFDATGAPVGGGLSDDYFDRYSVLTYGRTSGPRTYGVLTAVAGQSGPTIGPGDYYVATCSFGYSIPAAGFVFGSTGPEMAGILKVTVATNMPPVVDYDMGIIKTLNSRARTPDLSLAAGQVRWITFRTEVATDAATFFCDMDTLGSSLVSGNDTEIGLYAADGTLIGSNDDRQFVGESSLSYGRTTPVRSYPAPIGDAAGGSGAVLPAGLYYVSISGFNTGFAANFRSTSTSDYTGTVRLNVATNMGTGLAADLGLLNRSTSPLASAQFAVGAGVVKWIHFRTETPTGAAAYYVDIHSLGSILNTNLPPTSSGPNDTEIGLYSVTGVLIAANDDRSAFGESALTYGLTTPARSYPAPINNLAGDSGAVLPAGDYYVSVSAFNTNFSGDFGAVCTSASSGVVQIHLISNLPAGGCNAADVAGLGGSIGPDGLLTADDLIVYLNAFFANNLAVADLVTIGGNPPPDGVITADDLIFFLSQFFSPCI
ncbi:MAG: GC-type dockerin domain-anchored protein [Phycisphaerales bacterium]